MQVLFRGARKMFSQKQWRESFYKMSHVTKNKIQYFVFCLLQKTQYVV